MFYKIFLTIFLITTGIFFLYTGFGIPTGAVFLTVDGILAGISGLAAGIISAVTN